MISVISPAKKLNFNADSPIKAFSQCDFLDESKKLVDEAKDYSFDDIMKLMSVSENIANLTVQRFQEWKLPFDDKNAKQDEDIYNIIRFELKPILFKIEILLTANCIP